MSNKEIFKGKCPYNDEKCNDWNCEECKVNKDEKNSLKIYLELVRGSIPKVITLVSSKGNCIFTLEKEFFFTLTITKFKKLLKCLDFNETNFKNLNEILNIQESYKNKDKFNSLITDYFIKNYKGW